MQIRLSLRLYPNDVASLFSLSDTQDSHLHWPRGQNPDSPLLGFEPLTFGMAGVPTTAEPWMPFLASLIRYMFLECEGALH